MDMTELARLGRQMRDAQKRYFNQKRPADLQASKDWERRFDAAVDAVLSPPQPGLFDPPKIKEGE